MNILKILTTKRQIGNFGEKEAEKMLRRKGYKILKKNYVALGVEIDIIARQKDVTAFIEVKTRNINNLGFKEARPASSVTSEKQRKIIKAASYYISHNRPNTRIRFDVIEVYLDGDKDGRLPKITDIKHIEAAFDKNSAFNQNYIYNQQKEGSNL